METENVHLLKGFAGMIQHENLQGNFVILRLVECQLEKPFFPRTAVGVDFTLIRSLSLVLFPFGFWLFYWLYNNWWISLIILWVLEAHSSTLRAWQVVHMFCCSLILFFITCSCFQVIDFTLIQEFGILCRHVLTMNSNMREPFFMVVPTVASSLIGIEDMALEWRRESQISYKVICIWI